MIDLIKFAFETPWLNSSISMIVLVGCCPRKIEVACSRMCRYRGGHEGLREYYGDYTIQTGRFSGRKWYKKGRHAIWFHSTQAYGNGNGNNPRGYWMIGGEENKLSQIKYQFEGSTKSSYSHSPLSPTTYYGFWVSLDKQKDGNIHIDIGHANSTKPFMSWISEGEELWDIRYLGVRSYGSSMCYFKNIRQHKAALDGKMFSFFKIPGMTFPEFPDCNVHLKYN